MNTLSFRLLHPKNKIANFFAKLLLIEKGLFHDKRRIKMKFNPAHTTWFMIHNLLMTETNEKRARYLTLHLVGAKLQLRFPELKISNESASTADLYAQSPGDFLIGNTAFHITVAPMQAVFEKCVQNIAQGLTPFVLA